MAVENLAEKNVFLALCRVPYLLVYVTTTATRTILGCAILSVSRPMVVRQQHLCQHDEHLHNIMLVKCVPPSCGRFLQLRQHDV